MNTPSQIAKNISRSFANELRKVSDDDYKMEDREYILKLSKKLLVEIDLDEEIGIAIDYLQCQVDHEKNRQQLLRLLEYRHEFNGEFGELRYMIRELRESLMENLRYGKRTKEVDEILMRLTSLLTLANQAPSIQPSFHFAGAEAALSPRCSTCTESCRSAFRRVQVFLRKVIRELVSENAKDKDENN